ncbi:non-heme chloroperoxidase [Leucobacter komagatae]|uniref:Non-heme chloroperoxidase n=1 Tax=Leucobacter komagatae TaxID=55969 RepID=A0A542YAC2_9MICO|nr:alpha/beta fold hydrolase [Leucobacter komagatae]TQL40886.1 non-heme chloroperoxidase [Leucobacter komagatae]TQL44914.1 non-heme chloroperoxidase [Leucobacter komagatae]
MTRISDEGRLRELLEPDGGEFSEIPSGTLNYSLTGEARNGTVLLIAGLSMQRTDWSPELIAGLHEAGYATLAADNRDAGRSRMNDSIPTDYSLADMATDLRDLLETLDPNAAHTNPGPVHVVGMSMGGMLAQHLAMLAPERVRSLTSLMSTTGAREVGRPEQASKWVFLTPAPTDSRDAYLAYAQRYHEALAGPFFADPERARQTAEMAWDRGLSPAGTARQLAAIQSDGDRTERLRALRVPTLVAHGDADPLIGISGGVATAAAIPGASMYAIPGMGHTVPWQRAAELTARLVAHFAAAAASVDRAHGR